MKLMYTFGGGEARCYLEATVTYVTSSRIISGEWGGPQFAVPCLHLEYDVRSLVPISALLAAMVQHNRVPEIYIWDEHLPEPEVAILFRLPMPEKNVLDTVAGSLNEHMHDAFGGHSNETLSTMAEVNLDQSVVKQLIADFAGAGQWFVVDVREVGVEGRFEVPPIQRFVTKILKREKPDYLML